MRKIVTESNSTRQERQALFSAAGNHAVQAARHYSLPITYANGTEIIREYPDGSKQKIGSVKKDVLVKNKRITLVKK